MQPIGLLFKVLWSPGEAMSVLSKNPRVLTPIVFLTLFSMLTGAAIMMKISPADLALKAIKQSPQGRNFTDDQEQQLRKTMDTPIVKVITLVSQVLGPAVLVLILTGLYFGLFTMLGREGGFKAFFSITAFAFIPSIFRQIAAVVSAFVVPVASIMPDELGSISPAVFLDRDAVVPALFIFVNMIDLVTIWILALLIIGYGQVTRRSLSKAVLAGAVLGPFLVYAVLRIALAWIRGA
jgi:hypothetical protein